MSCGRPFHHSRLPLGRHKAYLPAHMPPCLHSAQLFTMARTRAEEHARAHLAEVMEYFWAERAEGLAAGQVPPLGECPRMASFTQPKRE